MAAAGGASAAPPPVASHSEATSTPSQTRATTTTTPPSLPTSFPGPATLGPRPPRQTSPHLSRVLTPDFRPEQNAPVTGRPPASTAPDTSLQHADHGLFFQTLSPSLSFPDTNGLWLPYDSCPGLWTDTWGSKPSSYSAAGNERMEGGGGMALRGLTPLE